MDKDYREKAVQEMTNLEFPKKMKFAQWVPEQQRAFRISVLVDDKEMQYSETGLTWEDCEDSKHAVEQLNPNHYIFRIKHVDPILDSVDWSHVSDDIISIERRYGRQATLRKADRTDSGFAERFSSFRVGNQPACTIWRPGHEPSAMEKPQ